MPVMQDLLSLALLGTFEAKNGTRTAIRFRTAKTKALLAYLAAESAQAHTRNSLTGLLWPEMPQDLALRNLSKTLSRLHESLGDAARQTATSTYPQPQPFILAERDVIRWNTRARFELDITRFAQWASADDLTQLESAVTLYRGEFLQGFSLTGSPGFETWQMLQREHYASLLIEALSRLAQMHLDRNDFARATAAARRQLALEPWRESAHRQLMLALAAGGERGLALAQYEVCKRVLARELGISPEHETTTLYEQLRTGVIPKAGSRDNKPVVSNTRQNPATAGLDARPLHNLPASLSSFIGREDMRADLHHRLQQGADRLITLTGLGGVGKTKLALVTARQLIGAFRDGIWWVPLAAVTSPDTPQDRGAETLTNVLANALTTALDFPPAIQPLRQESLPQQLLKHLSTRQMLIVIDNFEHLVDGANFISQLLQAAPGIRILVTSREQLNLDGELVVPLQGLSVPDPSRSSANSNSGNSSTLSITLPNSNNAESAQLFIERARHIWSDFPAGPAQLNLIAQICRIVEGLPLAIELAAGTVRHYDLAEVADAIQTNIDFLTSTRRDIESRHRSMRAVFEYSWRRLPPSEQQALAQLSVCRGPFSRTAALAVTNGTPATLIALADKSLLKSSAAGQYEMHELLRQFAAHKLTHEISAQISSDEASPIETQTRDRHARHYLSWVTAQAPLLHGTASKQAMTDLRSAIDNIHAAWQWAVQRSMWPELSNATWTLAQFYALNHLQAGLHAFTWAVTQLDTPVSTASQAGMRALSRIFAAQALLLNEQIDPTRALLASQRAAQLAVDSGDKFAEVVSHMQQGRALFWLGGNYEAARVQLQHALNLAEQQDAVNTNRVDRVVGCAVQASILYELARTVRRQRNYDHAVAFNQRALALFRALGDARGEAQALNVMGVVHWHQRDLVGSIADREAAFRIARQLRDDMLSSSFLSNLGELYDSMGDYSRAKASLEESLTLARQMGHLHIEAEILGSLGRLHLHMGDLDKAHQAISACLSLGQQFKAWLSRGFHTITLGHLLRKLHRLDEAAEIYRQTIARWREQDECDLAIEPLADLAVTILEQGRPSEALHLLGDVLAHIDADDLDTAFEPVRLLMNCQRVLRMTNDPRLPNVVDRTRQELDKWGATMDAPARQTFLDHLARTA